MGLGHGIDLWQTGIAVLDQLLDRLGAEPVDGQSLEKESQPSLDLRCARNIATAEDIFVANKALAALGATVRDPRCSGIMQHAKGLGDHLAGANDLDNGSGADLFLFQESGVMSVYPANCRTGDGCRLHFQDGGYRSAPSSLPCDLANRRRGRLPVLLESDLPSVVVVCGPELFA